MDGAFRTGSRLRCHAFCGPIPASLHLDEFRTIRASSGNGEHRSADIVVHEPLPGGETKKGSLAAHAG